MSKEFSDQPLAVYRIENDMDEGSNQLFMFNHSEALKQVRWRSFLADCELLKAECSIVTELQEREITKVRLFLDENYHDIMENFDPKVVKFKKKMKVIVESEILDILFEEGLEDDPFE